MSILLKGFTSTESVSQTRFLCSEVLASNSATVYAGVYSFTPRNIWINTGGSIRIACSQENHNNGFGVNTSTVGSYTRTNMSTRLSTGSIGSEWVQVFTDEMVQFGFILNLTELTLTYVINGVAQEPVVVPEGSTFLGGNMQPFIRGAAIEDKDTEWHELAYWHNADDPLDLTSFVPSVSDLVAATSELGVIPSLVTPATHIEPVGTNGVIASVFPDLVGTKTWNQDNGYTEGDYAPVFIGPPADIEVISDSTARTISIEGPTPAGTGTTYIIIDTSDNMPTIPSVANIVSGLLEDGVTAAEFSDNMVMVTNEIDFVYSTATPGKSYSYAIVQDKDGEGDYTSVAFGTISTKLPVLKPDGENLWYSSTNELIVSENDITANILTESGWFQITGVSVNESSEGQVDVTPYIVSGADVDIGDTVQVYLARSNGETLGVFVATIKEG